MKMKCSICYGEVEIKRLPNVEIFWDKGENAAPYEGRCCSKCNDLIVIPTRMGMINPEAIYLGQALIVSKFSEKEREEILAELGEEE